MVQTQILLSVFNAIRETDFSSVIFCDGSYKFTRLKETCIKERFLKDIVALAIPKHVPRINLEVFT